MRKSGSHWKQPCFLPQDLLSVILQFLQQPWYECIFICCLKNSGMSQSACLFFLIVREEKNKLFGVWSWTEHRRHEEPKHERETEMTTSEISISEAVGQQRLRILFLYILPVESYCYPEATMLLFHTMAFIRDPCISLFVVSKGVPEI